MNKNPIWKSLIAATVGAAIGLAVEGGVGRFLDSRHDNEFDEDHDLEIEPKNLKEYCDDPSED